MTNFKVGDRVKLVPFEQSIKLGIKPSTRDGIYGISRTSYEAFVNSKELVIRGWTSGTTKSAAIEAPGSGVAFYIPIRLIIGTTPKISDKLKKKLFDNFKIRV